MRTKAGKQSTKCAPSPSRQSNQKKFQIKSKIISKKITKKILKKEQPAKEAGPSKRKAVQMITFKYPASSSRKWRNRRKKKKAVKKIVLPEKKHVLKPFSIKIIPVERNKVYQGESIGFEKIVSKSRSIVHYLSMVKREVPIAKSKSEFLQSLSRQNYASLVTTSVVAPFDTRVTSVVNHPSKANLVAAASKNGELALFDLNQGHVPVRWIDGIGPGGNIVAIKFHPQDPNTVYTASVSGKVKRQSFAGHGSLDLLNSYGLENWCCSLDVAADKKIIGIGDCSGMMYLITQEGKFFSRNKKIHQCKVTSVQFCPKDSNLVLTSSLDNTVKLWDLRMLAQPGFPLHVMYHENGVNSAYFSPSCASILTTDMYNEIRVYSNSAWDLETVISHPHRQDPYLSPIKASWCPWNDEIMIGRHPDRIFSSNDQATIDFYNAHTGKELYRLESLVYPSAIMSSCFFNSNGTTMMSSADDNLTFWEMKKENQSDCFRPKIFYLDEADDERPNVNAVPKMRMISWLIYKS